MEAYRPHAKDPGALDDLIGYLPADPSVDAMIGPIIAALFTAAAGVAAALVATCDPPPAKPVLRRFVGASGTPGALGGATAIPSYTFPDTAVPKPGHAATRAALRPLLC